MMLGGSVFDQNKAMLNLFELSTGMASTKVLSERAHSHREGSPVRRSRTDTKRTGDPAKAFVEDKLASTRSSLSNKSDASPIKTLLAKDIAKQVESNRKPPSVVARLMGLEDDLPAQEQALNSAKRNLRRSYSHDNMVATHNLQQQEQHRYNKTVRDMHISPKETVEFKDVYAVCEEALRTHHIQDQTFSGGRSSRNKSDTRIEVVRQKFIEAKRLAADENFLHSKEFQEALEVLSSNKDLFLKFLEEPSSVIANPQNGHRTMPATSQTKRITVLKPLKSVENEGARETRTCRVNGENDFVMAKSHKRSHSAEDTLSQTNRIVVLKPSPGKPNRTRARLTPRSAPSEQVQRTDFIGDLEDDTSTLRYDRVLDTSVQYLKEDLHRWDESLLSSVYSNGYIGDESSFSRSEGDYIDEDGGSLSDSEVVSPVSRNSWDYIKRYSSTYSSSTYSRASHSHSAESSVIKEAKKRLSERWTTVACDEVIQEVKLPRSSRTLGDMLLREAEKEETVAVSNSASSSRPCGTENELAMQATCISMFREAENGESSPRNLARSKSLPVSSAMLHNMVVSANSESCKTSKVDARPGKGKLSFKGKVSSFFFPRSKSLAKEKTILPSDISDEKVEVSFPGENRSETDRGLGDEQMAFCKDKLADNSTIQTSYCSKDVGSMEAPVSSDCPSWYSDELSSNGGLKCMRDQPSPTSVLDAPFEESNTNEPGSLRSTPFCNERVVLRSWEDTNSRSPLHCSLNFSDADDDESECYALVQKIVSAAGLGNLQVSMVFTGWYLADCPLDPALCDKFLDRKEEAAKSRERRSNQKLLFDCVNMALVETGQGVLQNTYPWSKACFGARRETLSRDLGEEVWNHVRGWLYGAENFAANGCGNAATMLERIVHQEVEVGGWMKSERSETDEITKQITIRLLEELVGEAVVDLAVCFPQQGIPVPMPNL